jgi:pimeloyl-ACP methyl ester carboxylesterase
MRARTIGLLSVLLALALAAPAAAQQTWRPCTGAATVECTTVTVPLDRSGAVPGSVPLRFARVGRQGGPVLMYLSGGPGGAGVSEMLGVMAGLPELPRRFTVVGFDQRGTGRSGLIRCPEMQRDRRVRSTSAAARCAARLGARRSFYTTPDSVEDMEAIRTALGAPRLTLLGISYGTQLAIAYARAHPAAVDRLILDSVVDADNTDPFGLAGFRAMPATLRALCPLHCRGLTSDPSADLTRLTAALRSKPLLGRVFDAAGHGKARTLDPVSIADLLYDADYAPWLRAAVPAGVQAALGGDPAPLLRLEALGAVFVAPEPASSFSAGRYSTVCEETPLPWDSGAAPPDRQAMALAAAAALGPSAFAPFDAATAFADEIELCLDWPAPVRPRPAPPGPYPQVPTLIFQGGEDLRTPPSGSAAVASRIPGSQRVVVPGVGHAVLSADSSSCGHRRLLLFLRGQNVAGRCPRVPTGVPPVIVPPLRFSTLTPVPGLPPRVGRTVRALGATIVDVAGAAALAGRGGGLRGGSYAVTARGLRLDRVVVVPGVRVTGSLGASGAAALRISGDVAAPGQVNVSRTGRVTGRLGGRDFRLPVRRARAAATARVALAARASVGARIVAAAREAGAVRVHYALARMSRHS